MVSVCLTEFESSNRLGCQLDIKSSGVQMQNELGQLGEVTDILRGQSAHKLSANAKKKSFPLSACAL